MPNFGNFTLKSQEALQNAQDLAEAVYWALEPKRGEKDFRVAVVSVFSASLSSKQYDVFIINRYERETNFNG